MTARRRGKVRDGTKARIESEVKARWSRSCRGREWQRRRLEWHGHGSVRRWRRQLPQ